MNAKDEILKIYPTALVVAADKYLPEDYRDENLFAIMIPKVDYPENFRDYTPISTYWARNKIEVWDQCWEEMQSELLEKLSI